MSWAGGVLWASQRPGTIGVNFYCLGIALCPCQVACVPLRNSWSFSPISKMITVRCELTKNFMSEETVCDNKISIIGTGSVGMACAISILLKDSDEVAYVVVDGGKLKGETVDLQHGSSFTKMQNVFSNKDYLVSANSNLVFISHSRCMPRKRRNMTDVLKTNVYFFKFMIS